MARGRLTLRILGALAFAQVGLVAACVDGVTPDCSDAAAQCGPSLDGAADRAESAADAPQDTSSEDTFVPDAPSDGDLDAGDEV